MAKFQVNTDIKIIENPVFLEKAWQLTPELRYETVNADECVLIEKDGNSFNGAQMILQTPVQDTPQHLKKGDSIIFDFGDHQVGKIGFTVSPLGSPPDAPLHLKITLGETPIEMATDFSSYEGWVSSSWLQEETLHVDVLPEKIRLPRRYSFRFVKFTVLDTSPKYAVRFDDVHCVTETSAEYDKLSIRSYDDVQLDRINKVGIKTLADCMQNVFEDGPKRDRRLWLGDLHLQAKVNYETFKNNDLVKRCLYLFAGTPSEEGKVSANLFVKPNVVPDDTYLFDYSLFFASTLNDYVLQTDDSETLDDLYETAMRQIDLACVQLDDRSVLKEGEGWWAFIDWNDDILKQAACHGVLMYVLKAGINLARMKGDDAKETILKDCYDACKSAANQYLKNDDGDYVCEDERKASLQSQVWMVLGGAPDAEEAHSLMARWMETSLDDISTPYMMHYLIQALIDSENKGLGLQELRRYWGGMIDNGADTFWEAYKPNDPTFSPYDNTIINSYCHAWSCTPTVLLNQLI